MAGRTVKRLFDLEIDEISLVDRSANQHADVAIAKRDEGNMPTLMDADGYAVDEAELEVGDFVYDAESGEEFEVVEDTDEDTEPDEVGKSAGTAFMGAARGAETHAGVSSRAALMGSKARRLGGNRKVQTGAAAVTGLGVGRASKSLGASVYEELSKSLGNDARDTVISKALQDAQDEVVQARFEAQEAREISKSLQDQRELEEYVDIAKSYGLPGDPIDIGIVMKSAADSMPADHVEYLHNLLGSVGEQLFLEQGSGLGMQDSSVMSQVEAMAQTAVGKADVSEAQAVVELFSSNEDAYDAYLAETR